MTFSHTAFITRHIHWQVLPHPVRLPVYPVLQPHPESITVPWNWVAVSEVKACEFWLKVLSAISPFSCPDNFLMKQVTTFGGVAKNHQACLFTTKVPGSILKALVSVDDHGSHLWPPSFIWTHVSCLNCPPLSPASPRKKLGPTLPTSVADRSSHVPRHTHRKPWSRREQHEDTGTSQNYLPLKVAAEAFGFGGTSSGTSALQTRARWSEQWSLPSGGRRFLAEWSGPCFGI